MEILIKYLSVFAIGGILCMIAQILIDRTRMTPARILVGYVVAGVFLTATKVYDPLVDFAKAGATVPLSGFGYALAKGVEKAVDEKGLIGVLTGGLSATASGITAVLVLAFLAAIFFKSKSK